MPLVHPAAPTGYPLDPSNLCFSPPYALQEQYMSKPSHHRMQGGQPTSHWDNAATPIDWVDPSRHGSVMIGETGGTSEGQVLPSALDIDQRGAYFPERIPFQTSVVYDTWSFSSNALIPPVQSCSLTR